MNGIETLTGPAQASAAYGQARLQRSIVPSFRHSYGRAAPLAGSIAGPEEIFDGPTPMTKICTRVLPLVLAQLAFFAFNASAQELQGERLFRQRCASCHTLQQGQNRIGPHLSGVVGRTAGQVEGARYSAALRNKSIVWDEATLDRFLSNPKQFAPGTTMSVAVPNAGEREALVTFLKRNP
ncbi:c-type cytochrome [Burkholderia sola]|uniref:c-type cytochrome n=1 Tax=Burkholderia sola TaxID=2843302 RepID=UPI0023DE1165|nr:c-type cytochrome [Burkholderia sola]MDF3086227.1 c-type cytochrome [Burkholderia sola]